MSGENIKQNVKISLLRLYEMYIIRYLKLIDNFEDNKITGVFCYLSTTCIYNETHELTQVIQNKLLLCFNTFKPQLQGLKMC